MTALRGFARFALLRQISPIAHLAGPTPRSIFHPGASELRPFYRSNAAPLCHSGPARSIRTLLHWGDIMPEGLSS